MPRATGPGRRACRIHAPAPTGEPPGARAAARRGRAVLLDHERHLRDADAGVEGELLGYRAVADRALSPGSRGGEGLIRRIAWGIVIAALLLACGVVATAGTGSYRRDDFWCLRTAGQLVLERRDPYDERTWAGAAIVLPSGEVVKSACTGAVFAYPLWTAIFMVPFAMLPPDASATLWIAVSVGAVAWGASWCWSAFGGPSRSALLCAVLVAFSQPLWFVLRYGQTTAIELGLLGLTAWALSRGRERSAGFGFASFALKPQLVVLAWLAVLAEAVGRDRRPFLVAAAGAGFGGAAVSLVVAPSWPIEWLGTVLGPRLRVAALLPTVWGLANDALGSPAWGGVLVIALVVVLAALLRGVAVDRVALLALGVPVRSSRPRTCGATTISSWCCRGPRRWRSGRRRDRAAIGRSSSAPCSSLRSCRGSRTPYRRRA